MIISASYRTDIPAFHADWFAARLKAGFCTVRNPYSGKLARVPLNGDNVDGFVFWTRRLEPFRPVLDRLRADRVPFTVQYTITGYPRALESAVIDWRRAADDIRATADAFGPRAVVWRYDPVLLTSLTPREFHLEQIGRIADRLGGAVDEVVLSVAQIYRKSERNIARAAERHGFDWSDPDDAAKTDLLRGLGEIAVAVGLTPTVCSQPDLLGGDLSPARCIDAGRLSDVAGRPITARTKGNRPGCLCAESRDIGAYDTCPHGCVYCYAVQSQPTAKRRLRALARHVEDTGERPEGL